MGLEYAKALSRLALPPRHLRSGRAPATRSRRARWGQDRIPHQSSKFYHHQSFCRDRSPMSRRGSGLQAAASRLSTIDPQSCSKVSMLHPRSTIDKQGTEPGAALSVYRRETPELQQEALPCAQEVIYFETHAPAGFAPGNRRERTV